MDTITTLAPSVWVALVVVLALVDVTFAGMATPITLNCYSAELVYNPAIADTGNLGNAWNDSFTDSSWAQWRGDVRGGHNAAGRGYFYNEIDPSTPNAGELWVEYSFYGTGVEFFGYFGLLGNGKGGTGSGFPSRQATIDSGNATLSLKGNGNTTPVVTTAGTMDVTSPQSLGKYSGLPLGSYTARLTPTAGTISFTHLDVQMQVGGATADVGQALTNPNTYRPYIINTDTSATMDPTFGKFMDASGNSPGSWTCKSDQNRPRCDTQALNDKLLIDLGVGNSFMRINGTANNNHGKFQIDFNPPRPGRDASGTYWGYADWWYEERTLFAIGLDPAIQYQVTITNLLDGTGDPKFRWFDITSLQLWKVPTTATATGDSVIGATSKPKGGGGRDDSRVAAIAGGAAGGVAGLAAVCVSAWLLWRHWKKHGGIQQAGTLDLESFVSTPFVIDSTDQASASHPPGSPTTQQFMTGSPSNVLMPGAYHYGPQYAGGAIDSSPSRQMSISGGSSPPLPTFPLSSTNYGNTLPPGMGPAVMGTQGVMGLDGVFRPTTHLSPSSSMDPYASDLPAYEASSSITSDPDLQSSDTPLAAGQSGLGRTVGGHDTKSRPTQ